MARSLSDVCLRTAVVLPLHGHRTLQYFTSPLQFISIYLHYIYHVENGQCQPCERFSFFLLQQYFISHFTDHLETSWRLVSHQKQTNLSSAAIGSICHESSGNLSFFHLFNGLLDNHCVDTYLHDCLSFIIV